MEKNTKIVDFSENEFFSFLALTDGKGKNRQKTTLFTFCKNVFFSIFYFINFIK